MIVGMFHPGSGVGDSLFCYLAARATAERLGVNFAMVGEFKGDSFMQLDKGVDHAIEHHVEMPAGKIIIDRDGFTLFEGQRWYDPEFNFIEDMTIIDGCMMQDERYFDLDKVRDWLQVEPLELADNVCVIGFRGGEYYTDPKLGLTKDYWSDAVALMKEKYPDIQFEIHTDDPRLAADMMEGILKPGEIRTMKHVGLNWRSVRYAKHLIIANSAFYIIPSLLNENVEEVIAPRYWARRNIKEWSLPQNYYKKFLYV